MDPPVSLSVRGGGKIATTEDVPRGGPASKFKLDEPIKPTEWSAVLVGRMAIYVWGRIFYEDAFGDQRCSNFRLLLTGDNARDGRFSADETGNNEDCNEPTKAETARGRSELTPQ
jgi:hypothetical protein